MKLILKTVLPIVAVIALSCQTMFAAQDHMREALDALSQAKAHLKAAVPDKGGHRVKAIHSIDIAMDEVKAGVEYDRAHQSKKEVKHKEKKKD